MIVQHCTSHSKLNETFVTVPIEMETRPKGNTDGEGGICALPKHRD